MTGVAQGFCGSGYVRCREEEVSMHARKGGKGRQRVERKMGVPMR